MDQAQAASNTSSELADALVRFQCALSGLYLWEYIANIGHDWGQVSGKRPRRWTTWVYLGCRICTLATMVLLFVAGNVTQKVNCHVLITFINVSAYVAFQLAVLLVVLRIAVVWNHNPFVVSISLVAWLVNVAVFIWSTVTAPIAWQPNLHTCIIIYEDSLRDTEITTLCTDIFLVVLMLAGLVRKQRAETEGVWNVLYRQGLIWLTLAIVAEVPAVALTSAHVSGGTKRLFLIPKTLIICIGATWMHRSLSEYLNLDARLFSAASSPAIPLFGRAHTRIERLPVQHLQIEVHTERTKFEEEPDVVTEVTMRKALARRPGRLTTLTQTDLNLL